MEMYPQIDTFHIYFSSGISIKKSIELLYTFQNYILYNGITNINKIVFNFYVFNEEINPIENNNKMFPYKKHYIILDNVNGIFIVRFYQYYDELNRIITLPQEQQYYDYCSMMKWINSTKIITEYIGSKIINPFMLIT